MRVCLVALNRFVQDPPARVLARSLVHAGHEVFVIAGGPDPDREIDGASVRFVPSRYPVGRGRLRRMLRRMQPALVRTRVYHRALSAAAAAVRADIYHPTTAAAVPVAVRAARAGGVVARAPEWPSAGSLDLIALAPANPGLSQPVGSDGESRGAGELPSTDGSPQAGRHAGLRLALCYRKTDTNPGRYLEAALVRAGVQVDVLTNEVDWGALPAGLDGAVFVESPYPALRVVGSNPGVPTLFWVHHGEHRLMTNVRLADRYGADAVLLGHSWHLAHRFPVPVHRFPFGYAPELHGEPVPFADRTVDVGFVGAGIDDGSDAYASRRAVLSEIEATLGSDGVNFVNGVTAAEMAAVYASSRVVVDEWGSKHFPITMRVFEALGAGALLVGVAAPGVETLLTAGEHFIPLSDDPGEQIRGLLATGSHAARVAAAGHRAAVERHSYDHRVDLLVDILEKTGHHTRPTPQATGLAAAIDADADVHRVAAFGARHLADELPLHEVWDGDALGDRLGVRSFDAAAIGSGVEQVEPAIRSAYRFVYLDGAGTDAAAAVDRLRPGAVRADLGGGIVRFDVEDR